MRPAYSTVLPRRLQLIVEPLDLEYLAAVAVAEDCEYMIHDPVVTGRSFVGVLDGFRPDIVAVTGYYPARDRMLEYARRAKEALPQALTLMGGVHAELNYADFYRNAVDLVVHSGGAATFREIVRAVAAGAAPRALAGTCCRSESGEWVRNESAAFEPADLPVPDRSHFYEHFRQFSYLHHGPVALVKTAYGCPFHCSFCYCRLLNEGKYSARPLDQVIAEIAAIGCDRIWIVDDTFLLDAARARRFADLLKRAGVRKQFIIYSRAEFIARNPDLVPLLKNAGVIDVIVGFEAVTEAKLRDYRKLVTEAESRRCVQLLHAAGIECTGLFIMDVDASCDDFRALARWTRDAGLTTYTLSIFSPYPGTAPYEEYSGRFTTADCRKWDLLHLVMAPTAMTRTSFYASMLWLQLKVLFRNRALRRHVLSPGRRGVGARA